MSQTLRLSAALPVEIEHAAAVLRSGGTVAFPTETVYGLGANALDPAALAKIFKAKQRPAWDPLIVHVVEQQQLQAITLLEPELRDRVEVLARAFWPGPLTLLLPRSSLIPDAVTAGRPLVGVRIPAHPVARALLLAAGLPVAAPSANTFGHTSPTTAAHVLADLDGRIDAVLDGGPTTVGLESTVLDPGATPMMLYRPGAITAQAITDATSVTVQVFQLRLQAAVSGPDALPSPGVGIRHYAPRARIVLAEGSANPLRQAVDRAYAEVGNKTGVLVPADWPVRSDVLVEVWGKWEDSADLAAHLFAGLRSLEKRGAAVIVCPMPAPGGIHDAIRDRLTKAAWTA